MASHAITGRLAAASDSPLSSFTFSKIRTSGWGHLTIQTEKEYFINYEFSFAHIQVPISNWILLLLLLPVVPLVLVSCHPHRHSVNIPFFFLIRPVNLIPSIHVYSCAPALSLGLTAVLLMAPYLFINIHLETSFTSWRLSYLSRQLDYNKPTQGTFHTVIIFIFPSSSDPVTNSQGNFFGHKRNIPHVGE